MKKKSLIIILFLVIFIFPFSVSAKVKCSEINKEIEHYNSLVEAMDDLTCDDIQDMETVNKCNKYKTEKALSLSKLFSYNDEKVSCNKAALQAIVNENKDNCTNVFGTKLKDIANNGLNFFYVIAPFLLIIFGMLDFSKIVVMQDPNTIKESRKKFVKRVISFLLIYMIPVILNFMLKFNVSGIDYNTSAYSCLSSVTFQMERWETIYVPRANSNSLRGGSASDIMTAAEKVHNDEIDWCYYTDPNCGGGLFWNDIERSMNNPNKVTCCATFVGVTLYVAGIFTEEEMNSYNYNYVPTTDQFLREKGWIRIDNYDDLQAGDVVIMTTNGEAYGHTQLYAGNGTWYNAGSTNAIQRQSPYPDTTVSRSRFMHAYRKP